MKPAAACFFICAHHSCGSAIIWRSVLYLELTGGLLDCCMYSGLGTHASVSLILVASLRIDHKARTYQPVEKKKNTSWQRARICRRFPRPFWPILSSCIY